MQATIQEAKEGEQTMQQAGYDQAALDEVARRSFENAEFEHHEDETPAVMEEFYPLTNSNVQYHPVPGYSPGRLTGYNQGITEHLATK